MKLAFTLSVLPAFVHGGVHYAVVNPNSMSLCNVFQTRTAAVKLLSVLFNSGTLGSGGGIAAQELRDRNTWRSIQSLSEKPANIAVNWNAPMAARDCGDVERFVEVVTTLAAGAAAGELTLDDLAETVQDMVDEHIKFIDARQMPASRQTPSYDALRAAHFHDALATPLLTMLPSCQQPHFRVTPARVLDPKALLRDEARIKEVNAEGQSGLQVLNEFERRWADPQIRAEVISAVQSMYTSAHMTAPAEQKLSEIVNKLLSRVKTLQEDVAHGKTDYTTMGQLLGLVTKEMFKGAELNSLAERGLSMLAILDATHQEIVSGQDTGPQNEALSRIVAAMCD